MAAEEQDGELERNSVKEKARMRLREFDVRDRFSHLPLARASVLLPLMVRAGKLHLLLTVRSMQMNYLVTPVVGFIEDTFQPSPNPDEVSNVFVIPLEYFIKPLNYQTVPYKTSSGYHGRMHSFTYDDPEHKMSFRIWGLTAHFAVFLALVIFRRRPTFEVDYDLDNLTSSSENYFMNLYTSVYERKKSNI
ncbi:peroxisomal coenzyme A diphosphatase NUDT7 isoform X3 [Neopsephotus bourkii]|uniref:peroxisomal coenzyme A diphosphatase NUDT7 isoform X3 n=1 Tax=Neopsephotus bourkii TaxID=309878 RepID=UPI002AA5317A|nr:peroxisomal coenzyme A diphosphatase NUDT7 isoform X3 [Neopsephotus bourkii]